MNGKRVVIESPYSDGNKINHAGIQLRASYARLCMKDAIQRGETPFASHLIYTQVLDDRNFEERETELSLNMDMIELIGKIVIYTDLGITDGMRKAIVLAGSLGLEKEVRKLEPKVYDRFFRLRTDIKFLWKSVCEVMEVSEKDKRRTKDAAYAKHVFTTLAIECYPKLTLSQIGAVIGRDHATVSYYLRELGYLKVKSELCEDVKRKLML